MSRGILTDPDLPRSVTFSGKEWGIRWGFRTGMLLDCMFHDKRKTEQENLADMINLFYWNPVEVVACGAQEAVDAMMAFLSGKRGESKAAPEKQEKSQKAQKRAYDFDQDADVILGDFLHYYGIMLHRMKNDELHWWEFVSLFRGLPEKSTIHTYMYYRTCDLKGLGKDEAKRIRRMRAQIRIRETYEDAELSSAKRLEKRNERWLNIASRYK